MNYNGAYQLDNIHRPMPKTKTPNKSSSRVKRRKQESSNSQMRETEFHNETKNRGHYLKGEVQ